MYTSSNFGYISLDSQSITCIICQHSFLTINCIFLLANSFLFDVIRSICNLMHVKSSRSFNLAWNYQYDYMDTYKELSCSRKFMDCRSRSWSFLCFYRYFRSFSSDSCNLAFSCSTQTSKANERKRSTISSTHTKQDYRKNFIFKATICNAQQRSLIIQFYMLFSNTEVLAHNDKRCIRWVHRSVLQ